MSYEASQDHRCPPYTNLRAGDHVLFNNHNNEWVEVGIVVDGIVRWRWPESKVAVLQVTMDLGRGPVVMELDVAKLKLNLLDQIVREI